MKQINISTPKHPNTFAMVDDSDYEWLNQWKWGVKPSAKTTYTNRYDQSKSPPRMTYMHRLIMPDAAGKHIDHIDHIDGNGLNNQRSNLRTCTQAQNAMNRRLASNNTSGFKGVIWDKSTNKWRVNVKRIRVGYFTCLIKAARAYDQAAIKHFGEFAKLNFPIKSPTRRV
jgi:hypothetical protein